MKVKDLMEACKDLDPDMEVVIVGDDELNEADYCIIQAVKEQCGYFRYPEKNAKDVIKVLKIW